MASPTQTHGEFDDLAARLRGNTLHIPNLLTIFVGWPGGVNARLEDLRDEINGRMLGRLVLYLVPVHVAQTAADRYP